MRKVPSISGYVGYTFHHQKSYVVPTLGQPYQPNGWVAHVGPAWGERWHANCDVRPTMPTMYQRWINVLLLTGLSCSAMLDTVGFNYTFKELCDKVCQ
jgi:hypothetical protein